MAKRTKKSANDLEQEVLTETIENNQKVEDQTDWKDLYLRLYADFDNYKKRIQREKDDLITNTKVRMLTSILDMDNDLSFAIKSSGEISEGMTLILSKLETFLKSQGVETIQTETYDED